MIISRTPFRVSFVGGGTDLPSFYEKEEGRVLSCAINRYLYVVVRRQIGIVEHKFLVNWAKVERSNTIDEIEHPIVREALRLLNIDFPIEISTFSEVPANTGLGSSSTFAVGLLHALYALLGRYVSKSHLAGEASKIEIDILGHPIGRQDQYAAAYGNINTLTFNKDHSVKIEPVFYTQHSLKVLESSLIMFYTKVKRSATDVLSEQKLQTNKNISTLIKMRDQVFPMREILTNGLNVQNFGKTLDKAWQLKRSQTDLISSPEIDDFYNCAKEAGAIGGKLLGAGGGGFLLICCEAGDRDKIVKAMQPLVKMNFGVDTAGTRITYYDPMSS